MKSLPFDQPEPQRLDVFAAGALSLSRSQVQKAIKAQQILVDDTSAHARTIVDSSSQISYNPTILQAPSKQGSLPSFDVLYEDDHVVVINKPAGVLVHETEHSTEYTLVDALIQRWPQIANVGDDPKRAGLVHRLDKFASGVMIVAKTHDAFTFLKSQFKNRQTKKQYTVLVEGTLPQPTGTITFPIARSKTTGRMAARAENATGREAVTHYDTIKAYPHQTLLNVTIETGRTHQIRVHFFALDHPVVGDTLYRQRGVPPMDIGRIFLHARELTIALPNGETKTFTAPLPKELEDVLERIPKL